MDGNAPFLCTGWSGGEWALWGFASMAGNSNLHDSAKNRQDEFYTNLQLIEDELKHYRSHFKGKRVRCNCDDPYESNFFKYFAMNFNALGLKSLTATCYATSTITGLWPMENCHQCKCGVIATGLDYIKTPGIPSSECRVWLSNSIWHLHNFSAQNNQFHSVEI